MEFSFPPFLDVGVPLFVAFYIAFGAIRDAEHEQRCFVSALDASSHGFLCRRQPGFEGSSSYAQPPAFGATRAQRIVPTLKELLGLVCFRRSTERSFDRVAVKYRDTIRAWSLLRRPLALPGLNQLPRLLSCPLRIALQAIWNAVHDQTRRCSTDGTGKHTSSSFGPDEGIGKRRGGRD
jgi:hypothetical protein